MKSPANHPAPGSLAAVPARRRPAVDQAAESSPLPESDARFRALLEAAPDAMMIHAADGRIQLVNAQAEKLFGYARHELVGQSMEMLMPERFRRRHVHHRASFRPDSPPRPMGTGLVLFALHKDGREIPVEISLSNFEAAGGSMVISSTRDVTERQQAEQAVRRLNEQLEERVEHRTHQLRQAHTSLQAEMTARLRLEQEILEISERERHRIGQDLHDDLGQRLAGAWCLSQALQNDLQARRSPATASAARITETLQAALSLTRSLARGLHPVAVEAGGLGAALRELASRTTQMTHVECGCDLPAAMPEIGDSTATHLYRIVQESVTNAVKHSRATRITIALKVDAPRAVLSISDDGCGIPPAGGPAEGMGLRIMPYRADMIGGRLEVKPRPEGGTVVACTFSTAAPLELPPPT